MVPPAGSVAGKRNGLGSLPVERPPLLFDRKANPRHPVGLLIQSAYIVDGDCGPTTSLRVCSNRTRGWRAAEEIGGCACQN